MRSIFLSCLCLSFTIGRRAQDNPRLLLSHSLLVTYHAQRPHFYRPHGRGEPNLLAHGTQRMQSGFVPSMTAFSVPQHKLMCTIAFGGSVRIARVSACLRKGRASLFKRELDQASVAVSATCLSTSVPHSSGTCLETGIYTTGGRPTSDSWEREAVHQHAALRRFFLLIEGRAAEQIIQW